MLFRVLLASAAVLVGCQKTEEKKPDEQFKLSSNGHYDVLQNQSATLQYHTGLLQKPAALKGMGNAYITFTDAECDGLPVEFDLRTLGVVPDVKDQGQCGSCWSFSRTASLESALLGQGKTFNLSEQELVSNDKKSFGCGGGFLDEFAYQIKNGQGLEIDFPYTASDSQARSIPMAAKGVSFQYVGTPNRGPTDKELKCALVKYKTVPWITVSASNAWGAPPSSEKTAYNRCQNGQTNHAVGVVGYWTDKAGKTQFVMKNSWGKGWGDKGFMSLTLGCDAFGSEVAFIEVEKKPQPPTPTPTPPGPTPPGPTPTPTPPGPCTVPKAGLPAEVQVFAGKEVTLGVKSEAGVSYSWSMDGALLGSESFLSLAIAKDGVYKLTAKNACAVSESQVRLRVVLSAIK